MDCIIVPHFFSLRKGARALEGVQNLWHTQKRSIILKESIE
jgi:hypothetical protein